MIDGTAITVDDVVLGVESSGIHSNGFSLLRKVVFEMAGLSVDDHVDELGVTVGEALLTPTKIYARALQKILSYYKVKKVIHGIAHITGGGLQENLERIMPDHVTAMIDRDAWDVLPVFDWIQRLGDIEDDEMDRVFNRGCGLTLVVSPFYAENIQRMLGNAGLKSWEIGRVKPGDGSVCWS